MSDQQSNRLFILILFAIMLLLSACQNESSLHQAHTQKVESEKGPHHGRILKDDSFSMELAIYETGTPPKFRVWFYDKNTEVNPSDVRLTMTLKRLGNITDNITFTKKGTFLQSNETIYEPHSFIVSIDAIYQGKKHHWRYDNFEGRTIIEPSIANSLDIKTEKAGPQTLTKTIQVYGKLVVLPENKVSITDRYDGLVKKVYVKKGQRVNKGQTLITIESSQNLQDYRIVSPIEGLVTKVDANVGEHTENNTLFELINIKTLQAKLTIFPKDIKIIKEGDTVNIEGTNIPVSVKGVIDHIESTYNDNQSLFAYVLINNPDEKLLPGTFVTGKIEVDRFPVKLAVKIKALQAFRDFTVVYAKFGDTYEVRMLELGRKSNDWVEVLSGLKPGVEYVTDNSYVIKADIEKLGATHDH